MEHDEAKREAYRITAGLLTQQLTLLQFSKHVEDPKLDPRLIKELLRVRDAMLTAGGAK